VIPEHADCFSLGMAIGGNLVSSSPLPSAPLTGIFPPVAFVRAALADGAGGRLVVLALMSGHTP